jgi:hypothetical protein
VEAQISGYAALLEYASDAHWMSVALRELS